MYNAVFAGSNKAITFGDIDDESDSTNYDYSFFHLTFVLASFNIASVITNWGSLDNYRQTFSNISLSGTTYEVVDRGVYSMWIKMATSWVCTLLYIWTLIGKRKGKGIDRWVYYREIIDKRFVSLSSYSDA